MASRPVPGSTVTWQVNYVGELPRSGTPVERWWLFESRAHASAGGYFDAEGRLWSPEGDLVAFSRQLFAEYSGLAVDR